MARVEPSAIPTGDFVTSTISSGALAQAADTFTIGTGLTLPAANGILQLDYDSTEAVNAENGPETVQYLAYNSGTGACTGVTRGLAGTSDHAHAANCKVACGPSTVTLGDYLNVLQDFTGASARPGAAQDNINNDWVQVTLGTESFDVGADFASSTYTVPITGYYLVSGQVEFSGQISSGSDLGVGIYVDGSLHSSHINGYVYSTTTSTKVANITRVLSLTAGQTIKLYAYSGDAGDDVDIANNANTFLDVVLLGAA